MYIFVFGVVGTIITFSVVAPLTYLANHHDLFYFTFYDKNSFIDPTFEIAPPTLNSTLPILPEKTALSSHLMLNSYMLMESNESLGNITHNISDFNKTIDEKNNLNNNNNKSNGLVFPKFDEILQTKNETEENNKEKVDVDNNNYYKDSIIKFSVKDILLFSAVISATDTVAALTFIKEDKDPKLFAILFGEGVLNDAVCIVLYRIIKEFTESNEGK